MRMDIVTAPLYEFDNLNTIEDVKHALEQLEKDIPKAAFSALVNFNRTYLIITQNVKKVVETKDFEHPNFLNEFDTLFASYYIDAVKNHLKGEDLLVPPAWKLAFKAAEQGKTSPFKCMVLGVNAHINNDIPQVLLKVGARGKHERDYYFVNQIIKRSMDEVIAKLENSDHLVSPKTTALRPLYKLFMRCLVILFRRLAWRNFRLLKRGKIQRYLIELRSNRIARLIMVLPI